MGASNAMRVYQAWGPRLADRPLRALTYMALVARDGDAQPWFGLGHDALSELALGCALNGDPRHNDAALRSVRRVITELRRAGAVTLLKAPTQGRHAHYRLWLDGPSPDAQRPVNNPAGEPVDTGESPDAQRPTAKRVTGRSASRPPDAQRPTHIRKEEERGANTSKAPVVTANCGRRARDPPQSLPANETDTPSREPP